MRRADVKAITAYTFFFSPNPTFDLVTGFDFPWEIAFQNPVLTFLNHLIASIIKGEGTLKHNGENYALSKGTHLILPTGFGEFEIIVSNN